MTLNIKKDSILIDIDSLDSNLKKIKNFIFKNFKDYKANIDSLTIETNLLASKIENENRLRLIKWFIKESKLNIENINLAKTIIKAYQQKIDIKIKQYQVNQEIISIRIFEQSKEQISFRLNNDYLPMISNIILNFLKRQFTIYEIVKLDKEQRELTVFTNGENFQEHLKNTIDKITIIGKKVLFFYDKKLINRLLDGYSRKTQENISAKEYIKKLRESFKTLELPQGTKEMETIKRQYLKLAKKYHPDRHQNYPSRVQKDYEKKFMDIKDAYERIKLHIEKSA